MFRSSGELGMVADNVKMRSVSASLSAFVRCVSLVLATFGAAQAAEMAGQASGATEYYAVLVKTCEGSSSERPELAKAKQAVVALK